jgi:tetratricopeptide (TPR) repeat protein/tRNA A-37 threonylcarbamoyl transferase component Bud32
VATQTHELLGTTVGHIRVIDVLGKGGMGTVFIGHDETLARRVALKVIRPEHRLDAETKARFLREARILSTLDHPGICRVHDFIEREEGDILVLELIQGQSLRTAMASGLAHGTALRLAEELLEVLALVHEQGVVHRDLKPDNVMLTPDDRIKVLDFGLARSLQEDIDYSELKTEVSTDTTPIVESTSRRSDPDVVSTRGTIMGTVGAMSPEQARGEPATPASDMYSTGLLLQELFTGTPAVDRTLDRAELLARSARAETRPAEGLSRELTHLIERLKHPAPASRPTAVDALEMIRRIADRPRRQRRRTLAAAVFAALALLAVGTTIQSIRADRAAERAESEAATAQRVVDFLVEMFQAANPDRAAGRTVTAQEILDQGAETLDEGLLDEPLVRAKLQRTIGWVYFELGDYEKARRLSEAALGAHAALRNPHPLENAQCLSNLGSIAWAQGRLDEAVISYERCLDIQSDHLDSDDPLMAKTFNNLALAYAAVGRGGEAEALYRRAIRIMEATFGPDHPDVARPLNSLANLLRSTGDLKQAEVLLLRAIEIEEARPEKHPSLGSCYHNLGNVRRDLGRLAEAEVSYRASGDLLEEVLGSKHPHLAVNRRILAGLCVDQSRFGDAEPLYLQALAIREDVYGPDHAATLQVLEDLSELYLAWGRPQMAIPHLQRQIAVRTRTNGPSDAEVLSATKRLASAFRSAGFIDRADAVERQAVAIRGSDETG